MSHLRKAFFTNHLMIYFSSHDPRNAVQVSAKILTKSHVKAHLWKVDGTTYRHDLKGRKITGNPWN